MEKTKPGTASTITATAPAASEHKETYFTTPLVMAAVMSSIGFFQYGYNIWVLHFPATIQVEFYNVTDDHLKDGGIHQSVLFLLMMVAIVLYPIGGIIGCFLFVPVADMYGRTQTIVMNNFFSLACAILMGFSKMVKTYVFSMMSRFFTGICSGIFSCIVPVYLTEIAPTNWRGAVHMVAPIFYTFGSMMGQIFAAPWIFGNEKGWPTLMTFAAYVALFHMLPLLFIPESPRYLMIQKKDEANAKQVLIELRGPVNVEEEEEELHQEDQAENGEKNMTIFRLLNLPGMQKRFIIILFLNIANQFAGYSAVYYYVDAIYLTTEPRIETLQTLHIITFICVIIITIALMLSIDSVGRRIYLLIGIGICSATCLILVFTIQLQTTYECLSYINTILIILFLLGHQIGLGTVSHLLVAEFFLQSSRCSGFAISGVIFWFCRLIATLTLGGIEISLRAYTFLLYLPVAIATFLFIYKFVPETKRKTFQEIQKLVVKPTTTKKNVVK